MSTAARVTMIPAKVQHSLIPFSTEYIKRRVAGYARVSTNSEEQLTSYEAQVDYYTKLIKEKEEWDFVKVYTDEGISATSTKKRSGFNEMIRDALEGKIDLIVTKSVSRFARNTVDTLTTIRQLKEKGVEVYFEKENIYTLDSKGELLITIMSSLAQEESRSISENVTWGQRKRFADGKVSLPYKHFLGYKKGKNNIPEIVEEEAVVVRGIYKMYLQGKTLGYIADFLTEQGTATPAGRKRWGISTVRSILTNEKYKGDALLQKKFTVDFLTKKQKVNEGEVPQYYVENSHPAIIPPETFDLVQLELARRRNDGRGRSGKGPFSSRVVCGDCGSFYGSKVWNSTSKYRKTIWRCNNKYGKDDPCQTIHFTEEQLQQVFLVAFNRIAARLESLREDYEPIIEMLADTSRLDADALAAEEEQAVVMELLKRCVEENARVAQDQEEYQKRYDGLAARYEGIKETLDRIAAERRARNGKRAQLLRFFSELEVRDGLLTEFDEEIWYATVDTMTVARDGTVTVAFRDGSTENVKLEVEQQCKSKQTG